MNSITQVRSRGKSAPDRGNSMGKGQELRGGRMNTRNCNKALIAGAVCEQDWRYGRCGQHRASQALLRSSSWEPDSFTVGKSLGDYLVKCPI